MQYNTQRDQLIIPEYGRTVHKMIHHACGITDEKERCQAYIDNTEQRILILL